MFLKKKKPAQDAFIRGINAVQGKRNEDTAARVKQALAGLDKTGSVILAKYKASKGPDHELRLAKNGAVFCTGKCWQYSKTGTCKHLDHFRTHCVVQTFGRIDKQ